VDGAGEPARRIRGRTALDGIEVGSSAAVDDVAHAVPRTKTLVIVIVAVEHELYAVLLEQRYPVLETAALLRYSPQVQTGWWKTAILHVAVEVGSTVFSQFVWRALTLWS
jgi:hypothetical protein